VNALTAFEFLAGGCGRIYDMNRCVDRAEAPYHVNGTPAIFNQMARENSDLMVWLGDAVYLLGIEHAGGLCPGMLNDWDTKDSLFKRFAFYWGLHDSLMTAMPHLSIPDNHDLGGNEFNKTMATLGIAKENYMQWWVNPEYKSNAAGQGLYSSYRYQDAEFFLLDNRSYRESTTRHLGPGQLAWLKQALLNSTATFKILISGTPAFDKHWGGRNFSITTEADTLMQYIKANNINGVLCYSADIHQQEFYGKYNDHTYPFFDIISGNLASDVGTSGTTISPDNEIMFASNMQTYMRTNISGDAGDRRYLVEFIAPNGVKYYGATIHEDMLKSIDDSTRKMSFSFSNSLYDSSAYHRTPVATGTSYTTDRNGAASKALQLGASGSLTLPYTKTLDLNDRTFSITGWINPTQLPATGYAALYSNSNGTNGITLGVDPQGHLQLINHGNNAAYTSGISIEAGKWSHITWKYDNVKLQLFLYFNGQLVQKWSNVATPLTSLADTRIGTDYANHHFNGAIDEWIVYGKLITDKTLNALSGYQPARGSSLALSTASDMVIPSAQVNSVFSNPFTVEFWGRTTAVPVTGGKLMSINGRVNNLTTGFTIEFSAAKKINISFGTNGSGWTAITDAGNVWQEGEWNHVALSAVPNDSIYLYVNGNKAASVKYSTYVANSFGLALAKSVSYGQPIQFDMDELRIWNAVQPADSIRKRMHAELKGNENNLAFYYNFSPLTDTTIRSTGLNSYELKLRGAAIRQSTAPVAQFLPAQLASVKANWSIRKDLNTGLKLEDAVGGFENNFVTGKATDSATALTAPGSNMRYLKGGWQFNALNIPMASITMNLAQCLPGYQAISKQASGFYLLKAKSNNTFETIQPGYFDGQNVKFLNCFLDTGVYHLGWKVEPNSRLFEHGGALSLAGGHDVQIPYASLDSTLKGPYTIEFWTRMMQNQASGVKLLSNNARINNFTCGISFEMPDGKSINAVLGNSTSNWVTLQTKTALNTGEWNHVALTVTPNGMGRLYLNGELTDSIPMTAYAPGQVNMALGKSISYGGESVTMMDELRIWNKARTAAEIREQMHLSMPQGTVALVYNYTFDQENGGYLRNTGTRQDSVAAGNIRIVPASTPLGVIATAQQHHVTGIWSVRDAANTGLSVMVTIPDYETSLVMGKDSITGTTKGSVTENLNTLWQIDPLKLAVGQFSFDGPVVMGGNWNNVKTKAVEYYLLKRDGNNQLVVQAIGTESNDKIAFSAVNLDYGFYTLGWKNNITGLVEIDGRSIKLYPNPTSRFAVLTGVNAAEVAQVSVLTATGQHVPAATEVTGNDLRLDVGELVPGMYIINIRMKHSNDMASMKFIKQ
jgi:hypothetical protein